MQCYRQLKIIRKRNNLTQQQVADALGITRSAYCGYEIGRRSPEIDTLIRLAEFYRLSLDKFLQEITSDMVFENDDFENNDDTRFLSQLSKDERALIVMYRTASDQQKKEIFDTASKENK